MKELIIITLVCVASISSSAIKSEQTHQQHHHGKGKDGIHLGFFGSRGKRSINTDQAIDDTDGQDDFIRESLYNIQRNIRTPKGFFGMRGKKDFLNEQKRALLGIQQNLNGLRDRTRFIETAQSVEDELQGFNPKRAPSGFFGVRGKKFGDYDLPVAQNQIGGEKRAPKGFLGMRGKKSGENIDETMSEQLEAYDNNNYNSMYEKRVPSGFMGVRGKKDSYEAQQ